VLVRNKTVRNLFVNYSVRDYKKGNQQVKQTSPTLNMKKKNHNHTKQSLRKMIASILRYS